MAGFEEQLSAILGDREAMGQIMALARSLSGEAPAPEDGERGDVPREEAPPAVQPGPDLSALLGQLDPAMLQAGLEILRQVQSVEDRNTALLDALRPFLRPERRARLDRAIQIARMTKMIRAAVGALGGKEGAQGV